MKVLVIGQGGREHAIIKTLKKSPKVESVYCAPGNGGIELDAICLNISENDFEGLAEFVVGEGINLTIVGPENPLLEGIVDYFEERGLPIVGPTKGAAKIEGSKSYAKEIMRKYNIPTGDYQVFEQMDDAIAYVKKQGVPIVIKADGLAAGKGVTVAFSIEEAIMAIREIMEQKVFGVAGNKIVIEEFLIGEELTIMAFVHGADVLPMQPAQDHKPVFDGDKGPNTGGMGSYSPVPHISQGIIKTAHQNILQPVAKALMEEGVPFKGILYAGLILTEEGPKVIEFNARFGDPETQVVIPRLKTDLIDIFMAIVNNSLDKISLEWEDNSAVCVIMSSNGYPGKYDKGFPIEIGELAKNSEVFIAGAKKQFDLLVTSGGRVLGVTSMATSLFEAKKKVYSGIENISFKGAHYRTDIADKAINKI